MKKTILGLLTVGLVAFLIAGCKKPKVETNLPTVNIENVAETDSTIYGECVDAAMNSVTLLTSDGDTIDFVYESTDDGQADVQGGMFTGDRVAIIGIKGNEENVAQKVVNITSLMGRWASLDKNFEIKDGGVVESNVSAESNPYTSWKIYNGKLILSKDTFDILNLGPDSLYLENDKGIFAYKRQL